MSLPHHQQQQYANNSNNNNNNNNNRQTRVSTKARAGPKGRQATCRDSKWMAWMLRKGYDSTSRVVAHNIS